jgi:hypothetical protein
LKSRPSVTLNGQVLKGEVRQVDTDDGSAWVIPLGDAVPSDKDLAARYRAARAALARER